MGASVFGRADRRRRYVEFWAGNGGSDTACFDQDAELAQSAVYVLARTAWEVDGWEDRQG